MGVNFVCAKDNSNAHAFQVFTSLYKLFQKSRLFAFYDTKIPPKFTECVMCGPRKINNNLFVKIQYCIEMFFRDKDRRLVYTEE